jgi:hypothetical protein
MIAMIVMSRDSLHVLPFIRHDSSHSSSAISVISGQLSEPLIVMMK